MGISAGAGLAATACLVLYPNAPVAMLPMVAMAGGLLAAGFIAVLAYWSKPTPARLALIGVAVSAFFSQRYRLSSDCEPYRNQYGDGLANG